MINSDDAEEFDVRDASILTNLDHEETTNTNSNSSNSGIDDESEDNAVNIDNKNDDQFNDEENLEMEVVLQPNNSWTSDEIIVNILELYIRHKWTKASLQDNLLLLRKVASDKTQIPSTIYKLFQYIKDRVPKFTTIKHFYCINCLNYSSTKVNNNCSFCNHTKFAFFFENDIYEQLKYMFENRNLAVKLKPSFDHDEDIISDITDSSECIRVNSRNDKGRYDLTLVLNTDSLSIVKSSKSHCWPLVFVISELPEYLRESYLVMIGLWYDDKHKPPMNTFFKLFCSKMFC